jgi:DNA repair exonuclease SbcCD ATPase subunit
MSAGKGIFGGRLRRTRGADSKKIETIAVDEKRIAPDPVPSAKDLYASAKEIEALVYRLAEKWKLSEQSFWEEIDRLCQKYGRAPDILSIRLVEELIKSYEQHWRSLKSSERWDADLWDELRRLVHKHHEDPTQKMIDYQQQMTFDRQESLRKMDDFMQAVESQYQSIKQLQHEITELEQQRENETTKQDRAVQAAKEEHNAKVEAVILQAQDKLKQALEEQAKLRREALLEAQQINSQEKRIMQEGFDKAIKEAQAKMESEKIEFRRELQAKTNTEVATIVQENATLKTKLDEATTNVQEQVDKIRKDLDDEINRLKDEIEGRSKAFDKHLDGVTQAHATEINNLKDCHEGEKKDLRISLNREIQELKFEISDLRESNKEQILLIEQRNGVAKRELEESHKTTTAEMQRSFDEQTVRIKERHLTREKELEARISQLIKDHKAETTKLRNTISTLETEHLQEKKQMNSAFDEEKDILDRKITAELTRLRADFKAKKELLESSHAEATSQLRNDVEAYSQALLARDDFKPMPDNEIKSKFEDLAEEVKNLGRLEWQEGQTVWPAQVIKRLSTNTTLFKRRILQEMIWVILHKHIFCSPFRAFGEEGEIMERKWNDAFGAG